MVNSTKTTRAVRKTVPKEDKYQLRKKMKMEMLKYCLVWGFNAALTIKYFHEQQVKLSLNHYYELKREFNSDEATKGWYTEQALSVMETTHKQSIEQMNEFIKVIVVEIQQLQSTPVYIQIKKRGQKEPELILNPNHDAIALAKMMDTVTKLFDTRDDMLSATPMVQAIMNKNARDREKNMGTV